eukprot:12623988-Alexandrium_andersonii.AAC.1
MPYSKRHPRYSSTRSHPARPQKSCRCQECWALLGTTRQNAASAQNAENARYLLDAGRSAPPECCYCAV